MPVVVDSTTSGESDGRLAACQHSAPSAVGEPIPCDEFGTSSIEASSADGPVNDSVRKTVLENGISIVTESVPLSHSVSMGILFDCGPRSEDPAKSGLAHFCEHMLFQGTSNRDSLQINRFIDEVGGRVGAFTARDYTCFGASVLGDYSYHALDLLGDLLLNSTFPEVHIERERRAILCKIQSSNDIPQQKAHDNLKRLVWPNHPYGRAIAGDPEAVAGLNREDAIYFVHSQYTPDRMIISAVGAVDHDDYVAQSRDVFWRLFGSDNPQERPAVETRAGFHWEPSATEQAYFSIGIPAPPYADPSRYGLYVLNEIIAGGSSSRLYEKLRDDTGLVYEIRSEYHGYNDAGVMVIEGSTAPENLNRVVSTILDEVYFLASWQKPADDDELARSKTRIRSSHLMSGEELETRMSRLASQEFYFGRHLSSREVLAQLNDIDVAGLRSLAAYFLLPRLGQLSLSVVAPPRAQHDRAVLDGLVVDARRRAAANGASTNAGATGHASTGQRINHVDQQLPRAISQSDQRVTSEEVLHYSVCRGANGAASRDFELSLEAAG